MQIDIDTKKSPPVPRHLLDLGRNSTLYFLEILGAGCLWLIEGHEDHIESPSLIVSPRLVLRPEARWQSWVFEMGALMPDAAVLRLLMNGSPRRIPVSFQ